MRKLKWLILLLMISSIVLAQDLKLGQDIYQWNNSQGLDHSLLGRGINLGNYLEAPRYGDPSGEGNWNEGQIITREDLFRISEAGFAHVRLPVRWPEYVSAEAPYHWVQDYDMVQRVKEVLHWADEAGLKVVLNIHHHVELVEARNNRQFQRQIERTLWIWNELCRFFPLQDYPRDFLYFELINEPTGRLTPPRWNELIIELCDLIWQENATYQAAETGQRYIMIGTAEWGGIHGLRRLELPDVCTPHNTIITVHYYDPFEFTHQGTPWVNGSNRWIGTTWTGTATEARQIVRDFQTVQDWNDRGFPIYLGEFGAYSAHTIPQQQALWTHHVARTAESMNFSWAYWEYSSGLGAWNPQDRQWRNHLIQALIPYMNE